MRLHRREALARWCHRQAHRALWPVKALAWVIAWPLGYVCGELWAASRNGRRY